jgi:MFS family permease
MRILAFNIYYGAMILGGVLGGPIVDYIRRDIGKTQFEYYHTNILSGQQEKRFIEISAWRAICFFGFLMSLCMLLLALTYKPERERMFEEDPLNESQIEKLSCAAIVFEIVQDYKFWRFMLFAFVIVGAKLVFSLLFFMLPKMITQNNGEDAPFGVYVSAAPIMILIFLFVLSPI